VIVTSEGLYQSLIVGLGATAVFDLWALALKFLAGLAPSNWCLVGRWFCHMPSGRFVHTAIAAAPQRTFECAVGWIAHYAIGGSYGLALVLLVTDRWLAQPAILPALLFGLATMIFPLFVMQPCFGLGIASSKAPSPARARLKTLMAHSVFGIGLYLSALALRYIPAA